MKPFIKWAGGKAQLAADLVEYFPKEPIKRYYEPFLGGGAMFFHLANNGYLAEAKEIVLNDLNTNLMTTWGQVKENVEQLAISLKIYEECHKLDPEGFYYKCRGAYNKPENGPLLTAALFIYLNKAGFNGLYRTNKSGQFNVPFGKKKEVNLYSLDNLYAISQELLAVGKTWDGPEVLLENKSYDQVELTNNPGEWFVYLDPPYIPLNDTSYFTNYTADGFNVKAQEDLALMCKAYDHMGAQFALSNSDTLLTRELYQGFNIHEVKATRRINCKGEKRGKITELLVTNY